MTCNVSINFFEVKDIDGNLVDAGWIILNNGIEDLQNCTIDTNGLARFWWINMTPHYEYYCNMWYRDDNYLPKNITFALKLNLT